MMIGKWEKCFSLLLFVAVSLSGATEPAWGGCRKSDGNGLVSRTDRTLICIMVGPSSAWGNGVNYLRYTFEPKADEFSRFTVKNSYNDLFKTPKHDFLQGSDVSVATASGQALSFLRKIYDRVNNRIYPHLTAILDVLDGSVKGILWDNACIFCSNEKCEENTFYFNGTVADALAEPTKGCYITKEQCDLIHNAGGNECDLTVHIAWYGTDDDGNNLRSINQRFSAFNPKNIRDSFADSMPRINAPNWPW